MMTDQRLSVAEVARRLGVGENLPRLGRRPRRSGATTPSPATATRPGRGRAAPPPGRERPPPGRAGPAKKSRRVLRQPAELTFRFIADHRGEWPVAWMCDALEVSESGYYAWAARPTSRGRAAAAASWSRRSRRIHAEVKGRYGSPRMTAELNARGHACSENTVAELMRDHGIRAKTPRRFVRTTDSRPRPAGGRERPRPGVRPPGPNEPGARTSRTSRRPRGGCTWRWSRTCSAG